MPGKAISTRDNGPASPSHSAHDAALEEIRKAIAGVRFGEVRVILQDGVVVQIERVEKQRLR